MAPSAWKLLFCIGTAPSRARVVVVPQHKTCLAWLEIEGTITSSPLFHKDTFEVYILQKLYTDLSKSVENMMFDENITRWGFSVHFIVCWLSCSFVH